MQGNFNVMTLNVRGLRNPVKRRGIFSFLKFSLCFLQKHSENSVMKLSEGVNGEVLSFCMNPHRKGVCIRMNPSFNWALVIYKKMKMKQLLGSFKPKW